MDAYRVFHGSTEVSMQVRVVVDKVHKPKTKTCLIQSMQSHGRLYIERMLIGILSTSPKVGFVGLECPPGKACPRAFWPDASI